MVAGSEPTGEYRVQYFTPSYLLNGNPQPSISKAPVTLAYAAAFTVTYALASGSIGRCVVSRTLVTDILSVCKRPKVLKSCVCRWCIHVVLGIVFCGRL